LVADEYGILASLTAERIREAVDLLTPASLATSSKVGTAFDILRSGFRDASGYFCGDVRNPLAPLAGRELERAAPCMAFSIAERRSTFGEIPLSLHRAAGVDLEIVRNRNASAAN